LQIKFFIVLIFLKISDNYRFLRTIANWFSVKRIQQNIYQFCTILQRTKISRQNCYSEIFFKILLNLYWKAQNSSAQLLFTLYIAILARKLTINLIVIQYLLLLTNIERYIEVERFQYITQTDFRTYNRNYITNLFFVNRKSTFFNKSVQHNYINYFQFFKKFQKKSLLISLSVEKKIEIRQNLYFLKLENTVYNLQYIKVDKNNIRTAQNKIRSYYCSLINKILKIY